MTKEEIKSLVAAKIAGQGTNVDAASVLPAIIEGILDLIPEAPVQADLTVTDSTNPAFIAGAPELNINDDEIGVEIQYTEAFKSASFIRNKGVLFPRIALNGEIGSALEDAGFSSDVECAFGFVDYSGGTIVSSIGIIVIYEGAGKHYASHYSI